MVLNGFLVFNLFKFLEKLLLLFVKKKKVYLNLLGYFIGQLLFKIKGELYKTIIIFQ